MHACGITAGKDAKHKAGGNNADINDGIVLEAKTVGHVDEEIGNDDEDCLCLTRGKKKHQHNRYEHAECHHTISLGDGDGSRGYGALALDGVGTVGIDVDDVVEAIDG